MAISRSPPLYPRLYHVLVDNLVTSLFVGSPVFFSSTQRRKRTQLLLQSSTFLVSSCLPLPCRVSSRLVSSSLLYFPGPLSCLVSYPILFYALVLSPLVFPLVFPCLLPSSLVSCSRRQGVVRVVWGSRRRGHRGASDPSGSEKERMGE